MPLAAFPKTFGFTELKKGYFPHLFNTREHAEYVEPEGMSMKGRKDFETLKRLSIQGITVGDAKGYRTRTKKVS